MSVLHIHSFYESSLTIIFVYITSNSFMVLHYLTHFVNKLQRNDLPVCLVYIVPYTPDPINISTWGTGVVTIHNFYNMAVLISFQSIPRHTGIFTQICSEMRGRKIITRHTESHPVIQFSGFIQNFSKHFAVGIIPQLTIYQSLVIVKNIS